MKKIIIYFSGKAGAGKDTAAEFISNFFAMKVKGRFLSPQFVCTSFAKKIKEITSLLTGCTLDDAINHKENIVPGFEEYGTIGALHVKIGTGLRQSLGPRIWCDVLKNELLTSQNNYFIITDVRFVEECQLFEHLKKAYGFHILGIRLNRPEELRASSLKGRDPLHPSETQLDDWKDFDYVIENDSSFQTLYLKLDAVIQPFMKKFAHLELYEPKSDKAFKIQAWHFLKDYMAKRDDLTRTDDQELDDHKLL